jgi:hypothetical protein
MLRGLLITSKIMTISNSLSSLLRRSQPKDSLLLVIMPDPWPILFKKMLRLLDSWLRDLQVLLIQQQLKLRIWEKMAWIASGRSKMKMRRKNWVLPERIILQGRGLRLRWKGTLLRREKKPHIKRDSYLWGHQIGTDI